MYYTTLHNVASRLLQWEQFAKLRATGSPTYHNSSTLDIINDARNSAFICLEYTGITECVAEVFTALLRQPDATTGTHA